jgi:hypothetical protein
LIQLETSAGQYPRSWPLGSQFDQIESAESQLADVSRWGIHLLDSTSELITVGDEVKEVFLSINNFEESIVASDQLTLTLSDLANKTSAARTDLENSVTNTPNLIKNIAAVDRVRELVQALQVTDDAIAGASAFAIIMGELMSGLGDETSGTFTSGGPIEQITVGLSNNAEDIQVATDLLHRSQENSDLLVGFLGTSATEKFDSMTGRVIELADTLAAISPVAAKMVGVGEPIEYLVLGQTSDELRANGGFVSNAWLMEFDRGSITNIAYEDVQYFDDRENLNNYPPPPQPLRDHMNAPVWVLRDSTWEPNFPTAAASALSLYELGNGKELSNVIALNISAISRIVETLGGIQLNNETVTAGDIASVIEKETDENGTAYLRVVFDALLDELNAPRSKIQMVRLAIAIFDSLDARELIMYSSDDQTAAALSSAGWDGAINTDEGSTYYVIDSNVGWNKVDRNVQRTATYNVDFKPDGSSLVTLTTIYKNNSGEHSPFLACDSQWHRLFVIYSILLRGCYWDYLQIYAPFDSEIVLADPMPLPEGSVYAQFRSGIPGETTLKITPTAFGQKVEGLFSLASDEDRELVFRFNERNAWSPEERISEYKLVLRAQPGVTSRFTSVTFSAPDGYEIVTSSGTVTPLSSVNETYVFDQTTDVSITVQVVKKISLNRNQR